MSCVVAAASELIAPECVLDSRDDQPDESGRHARNDERRKDLVGGREGASLIERPEPQTDDQEERELHEYHEPTANDCLLRIFEIPRGQQPLHDELIGPVRRHRQECAADETRPDGVSAIESPVGVDHAQFARGARLIDDRRPAASHGVAEQHDR